MKCSNVFIKLYIYSMHPGATHDLWGHNADLWTMRHVWY